MLISICLVLPVAAAVPRVCSLAGVTVSNVEGSIWTISDISIEATVKMLSLSARAEAEGLLLEAKGASPSRALDLLAEALSTIRRELVKTTHDMCVCVFLTNTHTGKRSQEH
jgi:hypothetical protein